jgi:hypothetical protein
MTEHYNLDDALLLVNGWLGRRVRLVIQLRDGAPADAMPPSGPAAGWHVLLIHEASLGRPPAESDLERQLSLGTYQFGLDPILKLMLEGLPFDRIVALGDHGQPPHRVDFYLKGSSVILLLELLADS